MFSALLCSDCGREGAWGVKDKIPWSCDTMSTYYLVCECGSNNRVNMDEGVDGLYLAHCIQEWEMCNEDED